MFFEMSVPMMTGMERVTVLGNLREPNHGLPNIFKRSEKSTQGDIILALVDHEPSRRPRSSELLASEKIPGEVESDKSTRNILRHIHEASYRKKLLAGLFPNPDELDMGRGVKKEGDQSFSRMDHTRLDPDADTIYYPKIQPRQAAYDTRDRSDSVDDLLLQASVKERIISIFHRHGAVPINGPAILPFSTYYMRKYDQVVKLLSYNDDFLQLPFDNTLTNARRLAKANESPRKTYTFGDVSRSRSSLLLFLTCVIQLPRKKQ